MQTDQAQVAKFLMRVSKALGTERTSALSDRQDRLLSQSFKRLLDRKSVDQITDDEIVGSYEMITQHVSPLAYEVQRQQLEGTEMPKEVTVEGKIFPSMKSAADL